MQAPLAERMRPTKIDHLIGQEHLTGKGSILRASIDNAKIPSMIFWGRRVQAKQPLPIL